MKSQIRSILLANGSIDFSRFSDGTYEDKIDFAKELLDKAFATDGIGKTIHGKFFLMASARRSGWNLWDDAVEKIIKKRDIPLVSAIVFSLNYYDGPGAQPVDLMMSSGKKTSIS